MMFRREHGKVNVTSLVERVSRYAVVMRMRAATSWCPLSADFLCKSPAGQWTPRFASWAAFNDNLEEQCRTRQADILRGHKISIGERLQADLAVMQGLPAAPFEACDLRSAKSRQRLWSGIHCPTGLCEA